jgi:antitoxin component of MazEF toxin-antitoxin module
MAHTKRLIAAGNSLALVLDKPMLDATGITRDTPLEISTNGQVIVVSPVRSPEHAARFDAAADRVLCKYAGVFRRLAL